MGKYSETRHSTPNISSGTNERKGVVLHHTVGSLAGGINWIGKKESKAGYHVLIGTDGSRHRFAPDTAVVWHAGASVWRGRKFCNRFTLGFAFTGDTYKRKWTEAEMDSMVELIQESGFGETDVTTHRAVSPGRKVDIAPDWEAEVRRRLTAAESNRLKKL